MTPCNICAFEWSKESFYFQMYQDNFDAFFNLISILRMCVGVYNETNRAKTYFSLNLMIKFMRISEEKKTYTQIYTHDRMIKQTCQTQILIVCIISNDNNNNCLWIFTVHTVPPLHKQHKQQWTEELKNTLWMNLTKVH